MRTILAVFFLIPDGFKIQEMCIRAVEVDPWLLHYIPDCFKSQNMCDVAVTDDPFSLVCVPHWFVTQQQLKIWLDDDDYFDDDDDDDDDEIIGWHDGYKKCKAQKAKTKKELMPIAWHPSRWWDWCVPEDKKKRQKSCGSNDVYVVW